MPSRLLVVFLLLSQLAVASANKIPASKLLDEMIHRSTLAELGGKPFHLKATITDRDDAKSEFNGTVEEYWLAPTKWRRVIKLRDFSQTRIVNGDAVYEDNSGDYFPLHDEMLANEIVDPLPKSAVELIKKLDLAGREPGSGEGQCMAEKYFNDSEGKETRVLLAYNCKTGLLIYLSSPSCCYGVMTDYRKFHSKMIAFATKDDPINIHIDTLRDLDNPDETLFAISQSTPLDKRITTEKVSETEARKLIAEKFEIQWPDIKRKPGDNRMSVNLVIGRDGRVKEAWSYSPIDNATEDAALSAIRKWTFSPQRVDGIPTQVETTLIIPFPVQSQVETASGPEIKPIFDRMRTAGDLRLEGAPGFHMKASFHSEDGKSKGTYQETWLTPKKWRREVNLNGVSVVEVRTEHAFFRTFPGKYAPRLADDVIEFLSFSLPGDNGSDLHEPDWNAVNTKLGELPVFKLSEGYINPQGKADPLTLVFFVEEKSGSIRCRYHYSSLVVLDDLQPFGGKTVGRKLTVIGSDVNKMEISIDTLESGPSVGEGVFQMPGIKPVFTEDDDERRFTQPKAVYTVRPSIPGWHGKATCDVKIDEHGHVRDVDVKGTTDESAIRTIRAAIMSWEYEPATINGHPSLGFVHVNVE
jgi:hypothetical protein